MTNPTTAELQVLRELIIGVVPLQPPERPSPATRAALDSLTAAGTLTRGRDGSYTVETPGMSSLAPRERADLRAALARVMVALEGAPDRTLALDAPALHWPELGTTDAPALLRIALRDLLALGLIRRTQTDVRDVSEGYRGPRGKLPQFSTPPVPAEPVAAKPVAPKPTPIAPLPTPSGTGHGASTPTPAEPAPVVARPVTVEKPVVTEKPTVAPAPAPKPAPVAAPVSDPSGPVIADHLGQLTALLAAVVSQGRLDPSRETVEHRSRLALARRVAVLLAAHGPLTRSDLTRMKLSTIQKDALTDAIEYALAVGAIKGGERRRFVLADATLLGLDRATVQTEVELIHQRAAERAAREANKATQAALERVTA